MPFPTSLQVVLVLCLLFSVSIQAIVYAGDDPRVPNLFKETLRLWNKREASECDKITGRFQGRFRAIPKSAGRRTMIPPTPFQRRVRAGKPHRYTPRARCLDDSKYDGYYVGGGAPWLGDPRLEKHEGTWGWDYTPWYSTVHLRWWRDRRFQGGQGHYQTDRKNNPLQDFLHP